MFLLGLLDVGCWRMFAVYFEEKMVVFVELESKVPSCLPVMSSSSLLASRFFIYSYCDCARQFLNWYHV